MPKTKEKEVVELPFWSTLTEQQIWRFCDFLADFHRAAKGHYPTTYQLFWRGQTKKTIKSYYVGLSTPAKKLFLNWKGQNTLTEKDLKPCKIDPAPSLP